MKLKARDFENFDELSEQSQEIIKLATLRIKVRIDSLDFAQRVYAHSLSNFHEACLAYADDPTDDFETAMFKAQKMEIIDNEFEYAIGRANLEMREAKKLGVIQPM